MILLNYSENVTKLSKTNKKQSYPCGATQRFNSNEIQDSQIYQKMNQEKKSDKFDYSKIKNSKNMIEDKTHTGYLQVTFLIRKVRLEYIKNSRKQLYLETAKRSEPKQTYSQLST